MKFSERLIEQLKPQWEANHHHPFVEELSNATLPYDKFKFYLEQDYIYLIYYTKVLALGVVKANQLKTASKFSQLVDSTLNVEMVTHREYAKRFGVSEAELEAIQPTPTTLGYTNYMLSVAQMGGLDYVLVAILPCMWSYAQIGRAMIDQPAANDSMYAEWVHSYNDEGYQSLTQWTIDLLDEITAGKTEAELSELTDIFLNSTRYEYLFWDMAYRKAGWPKA